MVGNSPTQWGKRLHWCKDGVPAEKPDGGTEASADLVAALVVDLTLKRASGWGKLHFACRVWLLSVLAALPVKQADGVIAWRGKLHSNALSLLLCQWLGDTSLKGCWQCLCLVLDTSSLIARVVLSGGGCRWRRDTQR